MRDAPLVNHQLQLWVSAGRKKVKHAAESRDIHAEGRPVHANVKTAQMLGIGNEGVEVVDGNRAVHGERLRFAGFGACLGIGLVEGEST